MFISVLQDTISDDGERATYTGRVYARINIGTMLVQWGILPLVVSTLGPHRTSWLWLGMPLVLLVPMLQLVFNSQSFSTVVPALFSLLKTVEYALRGTLAEVVRTRQLIARSRRHSHNPNRSTARYQMTPADFWERKSSA